MSSANQPPTVIATEQTPEEERNIAVAKEYMAVATPRPTTKAPRCSTPMDYAESHAHVMASVNDLHIVRYDQAWAKNGHVLLRYTAEGSHSGEPYQGIERSDPPKKAQWSAAAIFEIEDGKVKSFTKDWDQKVMQIQLGWAPVGESGDPRWDQEMLAQPELARSKK
ncbi:hypothetical protein ANOM_003000 [Aspergillus nomiae NRRL 13137]|uniref:NTF2-like protein n=1 Tax=Aspergillus nomiae NRRL (strain ATCC 15546 / NRRL 13137 / CBS 260.88 / M93) TaxID=1509407 RepID=A0A0L1JBQ9_ASPN3|nr:uncharacterized protein ANOM_003000 [Aspergillus nomiae NRRL 13137]KNG89150.1 hypothetical protein ANOM_003000 [Aspergillus nomiae NRRL 13137]